MDPFIQILYEWIELIPTDFKQEGVPEKIKIILLNLKTKNISPSSAETIQICQEKILKPGMTISHGFPAPPPIIPTFFGVGKFGSYDISPMELARQITLKSHVLWSLISPREYLYWNTKDNLSNATNLVNFVNHFNEFSHWSSSFILSGVSPKQRAHYIMHMIDIAAECKNLQNYHILFSILSSLSSSFISRLKKSWALVDPKSKERLDNLLIIMSSTQNFKTFRDILNDLTPPCVPFVGIIVKDMTFIDDGNQTIIHDEMLNVSKLHLFGTVIEGMHRLQQGGFNFSPVIPIQDILELSKDIKEADLWKVSLAVEPRST
uniref:Ras-GEF domain-containing protein n=1 Tax=Arcella intermedia TaxID=1963864 RepID=A0A6B2LA23_9EUKA